MNTDMYINKVIKLLSEIEITAKNGERYEYYAGINKMVDILLDCKKKRQGVFLCGNGGSAGIAQHMTADYIKNGGLQTHSLYEQATLTCISNDLSYEYVFCKQLELMARERDILIAISSSGSSKNIVRAIETMREFEGTVITLTGFRADNPIRKMGDINIYVPVEHYGMTESIHNLILQQVVDMIVEKDGVAMKI